MDRDQFQQHVFADPLLSEPIRRAASAGGPKQFGPMTEAAVVALMFPVVRYVLVHIGLPWLYELKRYSELQRLKVLGWIDERYAEEGLDPDAAEAAGDALCRQLEATTDADARSAWERLRDLFRGEQ